MFTGIVEEIGIVKKINQGNNSIQITVSCSKILDDIKIGDSISVNGICLTIIEYGNNYIVADAIPETMDMTNLKQLNVTDEVNLERALRLVDRLGGHLVSGHIDGVVTILEKWNDSNSIIFKLSSSPKLAKYIINKGSITLDGTSLTVIQSECKYFTVALIPHTTKLTILGKKTLGSQVNIECDMFGKYIENFLNNNNSTSTDKKDNISEDFLRKYGFI